MREGGGRTTLGVVSCRVGLISTDLEAISALYSFRSFTTTCSLSTISCIVFRIVADGFTCLVGVTMWCSHVSHVLALLLLFWSFPSIGLVPRA